MTTPLLRCTGLTCRFGGVVALDGIDFDVHEGEIVGLIGPNGSGKSSTLAVAAGVLDPAEGWVAVDGIAQR